MFEGPDGQSYNSRRDYEKVSFWNQVEDGSLKRIDGYSRYTILPTGEVYNILRASEVRPTFLGNRWNISLVNDNGFRKTMSLARLITTHFQYPPEEDQGYDVEYVDENPRNIHPDNLYWSPRFRRNLKNRSKF